MSKTIAQLVKEIGPQKAWVKRVLEAKERGSFNRDDEDKALNWNTCACGQKERYLFWGPESWEGPWDFELDELGVAFSITVAEGKRTFAEALKLIKKIDERTAYLQEQLFYRSKLDDNNDIPDFAVDAYREHLNTRSLAAKKAKKKTKAA